MGMNLVGIGVMVKVRGVVKAVFYIQIGSLTFSFS